MKSILLSSLCKVFKGTEPNFDEFKEFSCLKNETVSFQLALKPETPHETSVQISTSCNNLCTITVYTVKNIPAGKNGYDYSDSFHYDLNGKEFPDLLKPTEGNEVLPSDEWTSFWFEITPESNAFGKVPVMITVTSNGSTTEKTVILDVINAQLPKQELLYTNWFHNDCLCTYYGIEVFSDEYWRIAENFIKNATKYGVNMILTPVFTPPLDTEPGGERPTVQLVGVKKNCNNYEFDFANFEKYISLCLKCGIEAFEISHLFTQWGASAAPKIVATVDGTTRQIFGWETDAASKDYFDFLESFSHEFRKEVEKLGIKEKCLLHISDEPSQENSESYKKAADTVSRIFPDFKTIDALSDIEFYKNGLVKTPVCAEHAADIFRAEVDDFWTYHCCSQVNKNLPNRLFSQPSMRNRILGILLYKYNASGFLQWGHNFWYSQYSRYPVDPFEITDADNAFPSGDAFVVYPGKNGTPLNSLRNLVFAEALQDLRALKLCESLTSREYTLQLIEKGLDIPLSFTEYPHEQSWLLKVRARVNNEISIYLSK